MSSPAAPTFDFSALGDLSGQAAEADQQFDLHYGTAQDEYLISCIYLARVHALTAKSWPLRRRYMDKVVREQGDWCCKRPPDAANR